MPSARDLRSLAAAAFAVYVCFDMAAPVSKLTRVQSRIHAWLIASHKKVWHRLKCHTLSELCLCLRSTSVQQINLTLFRR